jgi:hypothetical protein
MTIDTLAYAKALEAAGVERQAAEADCLLMRRAFRRQIDPLLKPASWGWCLGSSA